MQSYEAKVNKNNINKIVDSATKLCASLLYRKIVYCIK